MMDSLVSDVRHAFRVLRKNAGFTAMVVISLALGIAANTAIFTLIHAVMLRPLSIADPDGLVAVGDPARPTAFWEGAPMIEVMSYPMYQRLRDNNTVFSGMLATGRIGRLEMTIEQDAPERVRGRLVYPW
jgi:hypothetical protein